MGRNKETNKFEARGYMVFVFDGTSELAIYTQEAEDTEVGTSLKTLSMDAYDAYYEHQFCRGISDLMTGEQFCENVKAGCLMNCDGYVSAVYVDDYISNLGLFTETLEITGTQVTIEQFMKICKEYEVYVDWSNK